MLGFAALDSAKCRSVIPCSAVQHLLLSAASVAKSLAGAVEVSGVLVRAVCCLVGPASAGSACTCNAQLQGYLADKQHVLCRVFPPPLASNKKAELAAGALGLQAVILFRAYSSQVSGTHSFSGEHSGREREGLRGTFSGQHSGRERESSRGSFTLSHEISNPVLQPGAQTALT